MAGSMRKMAVYLGLVEDDRYDDYDDDGYVERRDSYDRRPERHSGTGADRYDRSLSPRLEEDRGRPMAAVREESLAAVTPMPAMSAPSGRSMSAMTAPPAMVGGLSDGAHPDFEHRANGATVMGGGRLAAGDQAARAMGVAVAPSSASDVSQITTIHPRTYNEAKAIGERFREGTPVIMNLTEMDDRDAKRLVDFAAGLVFGLHGTIERVTSKVFLLSPANVTVTAEDKARMAEGFFNQS